MGAISKLPMGDYQRRFVIKFLCEDIFSNLSEFLEAFSRTNVDQTAFICKEAEAFSVGRGDDPVTH